MQTSTWLIIAAAGIAALLILFVRLRWRAGVPAAGSASSGHGLLAGLRRALGGRKGPAPEDRARLRDVLIAGDVGPAAADRVLDRLYGSSGQDLEAALIDAVTAELTGHAASLGDLPDPAVIVVAGINGSGKTTTIAKAAKQLQATGRTVLLGAGDTFRAAAADQLATWGERLGVRVVRQAAGADPGAVAFDAVKAAERDGATVLIDTAGRVHGHDGLMGELAKIVRVIGKARPGAPHAVWLVLDGSQGQTALEQARRFHEAVHVSGVFVTKLDGEGRGGFVLQLLHDPGLPILGIGTGEGIDDLQPFEPATFAKRLVGADS